MTATPKPSQSTVRVLATALLMLGTVACSAQTASSPTPEPAVAKVTDPTIFKCVQQGDGWATIAQRGNAVSQSPLFSWNTTEFGSEYTPEKRCKIVSPKLTEAVANNGGRLGGLNLTTGTVDDGQTVVCVLASAQKSCNRENILFTLNRENTKNPSAVLAKITNFGEGKASNSLVNESGDVPEFIPLETLVDRLLPNDGF